jgi:hypothetical protein
MSTPSIRARSWLFTPATRPDRFAKASEAGADVAILDLEDAVAPKDKAQARTTALDYLAGNPAESTSLQRGVSCEPNFLEAGAEEFQRSCSRAGSACPDEGPSARRPSNSLGQ